MHRRLPGCRRIMAGGAEKRAATRPHGTKQLPNRSVCRQKQQHEREHMSRSRPVDRARPRRCHPPPQGYYLDDLSAAELSELIGTLTQAVERVRITVQLRRLARGKRGSVRCVSKVSPGLGADQGAGWVGGRRFICRKLGMHCTSPLPCL